MTWRPLLTGAQRAAALSRVDQIARDLGSQEPAVDASLSGGHAGIALFYAYLAAARRSPGAKRRSRAHLEHALQIVADGERALTLSLFVGLAGLAWTMQHVEVLWKTRHDPDLTADLDALIEESLWAEAWDWELDLVYGITGIGIYLLDHPDRALALRLLRRVCAILAQAAEPPGAAIAEIAAIAEMAWRKPRRMGLDRPDLTAPAPFDLGVAHGVPGILGFLGRAAAEHEIADARMMFERGTAWLRATLSRATHPGDAFVGMPAGTRTAWCYGDPGVAAALLCGGLNLESGGFDAAWAVAMAVAAAERPREKTGVVDATLCHGTAGLGHLYNRLHQRCDDPALARAAARWFAETLAMPRHDGFGGFANWWPEEKSWHADPGFLAGSAGIGLSLLAAASAVEPLWDRVLLLPPLPEAKAL